ncbi:hypothetical protein [Phenylobacterium sp.]|jgi:hypothetical protein|uniref:hypothetical protein n=1 Tax=Phenylobacterium sp. TaxID=1871053 RepID=UPI002E30A4AA|nr:hypothetical protein [Phenylobacterium sp.]HEX4710112.1 hypothetical protein [Phenylobacterium sp.]
MRVQVLSLLLVAAGVLPAAGQPAPVPSPPPSPPRDLIGALLDGHSQTPSKDEPDTASAPRTPPKPEPTVAPPPGAAPYRPAPRPHLDAPVLVEQTGKTPDAPPTPSDMAYDSRIRSSFASAQSYQGALDGGWTLSADGHDLYALQLVDRRDRLEGVWRDVRRKGSLNASGLVDDIQRQGSEVTLRFTPTPGAPTTVATLHGGADGRWTGELVEGGGRRPVILRRTGL